MNKNLNADIELKLKLLIVFHGIVLKIFYNSTKKSKEIICNKEKEIHLSLEKLLNIYRKIIIDNMKI